MNFVDQESGETSPNYQIFVKTVGAFPDRVKNLYFLYSLVLKALHRAENQYRGIDYSPEEIHGNQEKVKVLIADLLRVSLHHQC